MTPHFLSASCFTGRRILVTGASSGIGRATSILLSQCGAEITINGRNLERLEETHSVLSGAGHTTSIAALSNADDTAEWIKNLAFSNGPYDGIFHAAGMASIKPVRLLKQSHLDEVLGSSLMAGFGIAKSAAQKGVMADGGSIVYMSSVAGARGQAGMSAYSAAKAAVDSLVRSLACELAPRKIRVNSIAAGAVETEMLTRLNCLMGEEGAANCENRHLLGFGSSTDIAHAAAFLLSLASAWITGTTMVVDGGCMVR